METYQREDNAGVRFYIEAVQDNFETSKQGRAIFRDVEMAEIITPGDKLTTFKTVVDDDIKLRFSRQYDVFKSNAKMSDVGTALEQWPLMTASKIAELKALHIQTVEALANLSDGNLGSLGMGGREIREQARAYLEAAENSAAIVEKVAENERLKEKLQALESKIEVMEAEIKSVREEDAKSGKNDKK